MSKGTIWQLSGHQKKVMKELLEKGKDANYPSRAKFQKTADRFFERKKAVENDAK